MRVYLDPSFLIALYVPEAKSPEARAFVEELAAPLMLNELQELEFKNAVRQKVLRKDIDSSVLARCLRIYDDDVIYGRIKPKKVVWSNVYAKAEKLSTRLSSKQICRSFDLLHVAIAAVSQVRHFVTLDASQGELAVAAGMKLIAI